jgi:hypothetical protein
MKYGETFDNLEKPIAKYTVTIKVIDNFMKPQRLNFTNTKERISWKQKVGVLISGDSKDAENKAMEQLSEHFPISRYSFEVLEIRMEK